MKSAFETRVAEAIGKLMREAEFSTITLLKEDKPEHIKRFFNEHSEEFIRALCPHIAVADVGFTLSFPNIKPVSIDADFMKWRNAEGYGGADCSSLVDHLLRARSRFDGCKISKSLLLGLAFLQVCGDSA